MYDLVAVGNPVYDEIVTPYVNSGGRVLSGCSTNACLAARKLGTLKVALIGCVGEDYEARLKADLSKYGICSKVRISENTGGFKLNYDRKGDRTLSVIAVADKITIEDIPDDCLDAKIFLLGPILQEIDFELIAYLSRYSEGKLFLDPQGILREIASNGMIMHRCNMEVVKQIVTLCDIIKPNEHESKILTGLDDPVLSAKTLVLWGARMGIVTLADRGSVLCEKGYSLEIPAFETIAIDPTGAGDVYAGAFIYKYLQSEDVSEAALFASAAASIKVEYTGPDFPLDHIQVDERLLAIRDLLHYRSV